MPHDDVILTITGPTAVGKTALSLEVAEHIGAEVLSVDSRQVYRELTVGTAKPAMAERALVRHHFIDERSIGEPFSAGRSADAANARIRAIRERGRRVLVVGGSTLYLHALQHGLADIPDVPASVRRHIEARLDEEGADALFSELQSVDLSYARKIDPTKTQQLVRALEVYHGTGRPLSHYHAQQPEPSFRYRTVVLDRDRQVLYDRISRRVDHMLACGLVAEVQALREKSVDRAAPPLRTIGYREVFDYLDGGTDYAEMVRLIKRNTRRYAKRQLTWFRRYDDYTWLPAASVTPPALLSHHA